MRPGCGGRGGGGRCCGRGWEWGRWWGRVRRQEGACAREAGGECLAWVCQASMHHHHQLARYLLGMCSPFAQQST